MVTTDGTEVDDFYTEGGIRREVTGVKITVDKGAELLWYGRSTQNDWLSWVVCSGGPVYINGLAAGFVWGWVLIDGARRIASRRPATSTKRLGLGSSGNGAPSRISDRPG